MIAELTGRGFKLIPGAGNTVVVEQVLDPNTIERKRHYSYRDGTPRALITLGFYKVENGTMITASYDMLLNPGRSNQEVVTLLDSPDGGRLQNILQDI